MNKPKVGDWVLMEHPYLYNAYIIRKLEAITAHTVRVSCIDEDKDHERRKISAVIGVFSSKETAFKAAEKVKDLHSQLLKALNAVKTAYELDVKDLLND
jgi:hypothetical protein